MLTWAEFYAMGEAERVAAEARAVEEWPRERLDAVWGGVPGDRLPPAPLFARCAYAKAAWGESEAIEAELARMSPVRGEF